MTCPKCKENKAHRSHRRGVSDYLHKWFQMIPYRCHGCNHRFYAYRAGELSESMRTSEERKIMRLRRRIRWQRTKRELVVYLVGGLIFAMFLYYLLEQRIVGQ